MLRWEEKEDIDVLITKTEKAVATFRVQEAISAQDIRDKLQEKILILWIYHDWALEGEVLSYTDINAAIDPNIISDNSLISSYEEVCRFYELCKEAIKIAAQPEREINCDLILELYAKLSATTEETTNIYRGENPLHRVYYHDISSPDKIARRIDELDTWLREEASTLRSIHQVVEFHRRFMYIYPWKKHNGRIARLVSNIMLLRFRYPIAVLHSIDRQRYYEALRTKDSKLLFLYLECLETSAQSSISIYKEAGILRREQNNS